MRATLAWPVVSDRSDLASLTAVSQPGTDFEIVELGDGSARMVYSERCSITFVRAVLLKRKLKIDLSTPYSVHDNCCKHLLAQYSHTSGGRKYGLKCFFSDLSKNLTKDT